MQAVEIESSQGQWPSRRMAACLVSMQELDVTRATSSEIVLAYLKQKNHPIFGTLRGSISNYLSYRGIRRYDSQGKLDKPRSGKKKVFWDVQELQSEFELDPEQVYVRLKIRAFQFKELEKNLLDRLKDAPEIEEDLSKAKCWARELSSMTCGQWDCFVNKKGRHWDDLNRMSSGMIQAILVLLGSSFGNDRMASKDNRLRNSFHSKTPLRMEKLATPSEARNLNSTFADCDLDKDAQTLENRTNEKGSSKYSGLSSKFEESEHFISSGSTWSEGGQPHQLEKDCNCQSGIVSELELPAHLEPIVPTFGLVDDPDSSSEVSKELTDSDDSTRKMKEVEPANRCSGLGTPRSVEKSTGKPPAEGKVVPNLKVAPGFKFPFIHIVAAALVCLFVLLALKVYPGVGTKEVALTNSETEHMALGDTKLQRTSGVHTHEDAKRLINESFEHIKEGRADEALKLLAIAQTYDEIRPFQYAKSVMYQGDAYEMLGDFEMAAAKQGEAFLWFKKIPGTFGNRMRAKAEQAKALFLLGKNDEARFVLEAGFNPKVSNPDIQWNWLGVKSRLDLFDGKYSDMLKDAEKSLELQKEGNFKAEALSMMSFACILNNKLTDAYYYQGLAKTERQNPQHSNTRSEMYGMIGDILYATKINRDPRAYINRVESYLEQFPEPELEMLLEFAKNHKDSYY